jgi:hypothetical protein
MNPLLFLGLLTLGAAAVAVWVDVRFPTLAPSTLRGALIHVGVSLVAGRLLVPLAAHALGGGSEPARLFLVVGVAFPILVYTFLAAVWVVKIWRDAYRRFSH